MPVDNTPWPFPKKEEGTETSQQRAGKAERPGQADRAARPAGPAELMKDDSTNGARRG